MKKIVCLCLIGLITLTSGCQTSPQAVDRGGIQKAIDKGEAEASRYLENSSTTDSQANVGETNSDLETNSTNSDDSSAPHVSESVSESEPTTSIKTTTVFSSGTTAIQEIVASTPTRFKKTLTGGKGAVFDAVVIAPKDVTALGRYTAIPRQCDTNLLKKILFGERSLSPTSGGLTCVMEDGMSATLITGGTAAFSFSWESTYSNYPLLSTKDNRHARGCTLSIDEAKNKAQDLLNNLGVADFRLESAKINEPEEAYGGREKTGSYEFLYYQYVDNLPILADVPLVSVNQNATTFQANVNDKGFFSTYLIGFDLTKKEEIKQILSLDQAVTLIEKKLPSLWLTRYVPIIEISLEYMLNQTADGQLYITPCWHFCVDKSNYYNLSIEEQRVHDSNDLAMDAVTGEMFRIGDRYVFH